MNLPPAGFIGVGLMGSGVAYRLLKAGHELRLMAHRNRERIESLLVQGAREESDPVAILRSSDILFTCVPNADVVTELAELLEPHFTAGKIWIDLTTSLPRVSEAMAARLAERGAVFADAPVTGGPGQAIEGQLASLVGCREVDFKTIETAVRPYSKMVRRFGGPGRGHAAKLLNNLVTQGTMILLADVCQTAEAQEIDVASLYDVMMAGAGRSGTLEKAVKPYLRGDFGGARFSIANAAKDLSYAATLIGDSNPNRARLAQLLADRLQNLVDAGKGDAFVSTMLQPEGRAS